MRGRDTHKVLKLKVANLEPFFSLMLFTTSTILITILLARILFGSSLASIANWLASLTYVALLLVVLIPLLRLLTSGIAIKSSSTMNQRLESFLDVGLNTPLHLGPNLSRPSTRRSMSEESGATGPLPNLISIEPLKNVTILKSEPPPVTTT